MASERRRQTAGSLDEVRRRRRARRLQEKRRRAALRRRNALLCAAIASAVVGAVVGSGAGGGAGSAPARAAARPSPGGLGPPRADQRLVSWEGPVPILMYHVIASPPATAQFPDLFVDPDTFQAQMSWLARHGYSAVSLNEVNDAWFKDGKLPEKPVVLSFDDGYRGDYVYARPTLRRLRWPGVLNLLIGNLGSELTDPMVERLIKSGWELDSHTISHLDLTTLDGSRLRHEVAGSRQILQGRFHQPVNFFCYPAGKFDARTVRSVRDAGYLGATTELPGKASKNAMFELHRIRIDGSDGVSGLATKLGQAGG
ncbi:MAG TPA: polysaccharide deacetylase family protein [Solirubrobacterales bacterium]|nr:polysaccharide deacetylase family protein [Solirubrobacterales bacterium]